ncbi:hypothetical protein JQ621_33085 [Bradyrhizobium manausense]|uniref:hypothetical protein n=1 Tax=Bradyrhizobium manausense TaxID=989370 RepID=UPI001BA461B2|nr:hypothetical protein [Bradyrhizobium manausense]MBR1092306.1 hypothetical protein [Bradyrhizobium manausense]
MRLTGFRILLLAAAGLLGLAGLVNLGERIFPSSFGGLSSAPGAISSYAEEISSNAIRSRNIEENNRAQAVIEHALRRSPYAGNLWLSLALLRAQLNNATPLVGSALKLSYLTAPNDFRLMVARTILTATTIAVKDPDLQELAKGDIRVILTRRQDLSAGIRAAFEQSNSDGRAFLKQATSTIDPSWSVQLH